MRTEPELLNERLDRLAIVLDETMPNCAELVRDALELLKSQPQIVRCKDCKYGDWSQNIRKEDMIFCYNGDTGIEDGYLHEPNWFCAEGEKRTD